MTKKNDLFITILFSLFLGVFFLLNLLTPDTGFSPQENRNLQALPAFSLSSLLDGRFTENFETYSSDQFVFRNQWIALKSHAELLQGKGENNGVFLCEGEQLLQPFTAPSDVSIAKQAAIIERFSADSEAEVALALIPSSAEIYRDLLPEGAPNGSQSAVASSVAESVSIPVMDLSPALLAHGGEYIFYRTDHHWTSLGAYFAYEALGELLHYSPRELDQFEPVTVSDAFFGTAYSASGFFWLKEGDSIQRFLPETAAVKVTRYDSDEGETASLYTPSMLSTKDQYRYFLGGNCARIVIETGNAGLPSVLLIRDSYADSLVPFLAAHYSRIHLIDLRYYRGSTKDYIRENAIDSILLLYGVEDFCTDTNLNLLLF